MVTALIVCSIAAALASLVRAIYLVDVLMKCGWFMLGCAWLLQAVALTATMSTPPGYGIVPAMAMLAGCIGVLLIVMNDLEKNRRPK